jgi:hypothetical protein
VLKHWKYLLASSMLLAIFVATGALAAGEGDPLTGGERNPSADQSQQLGVETEIIGSVAASGDATGGYVTRQSNTTTVDAAPFTTNATGVATGLNADRVDGLEAEEIAAAGAQQANLFARVNPDGSLDGDRGAASSSRSGPGDYSIVFDGDVSTCAYIATVNSTQDPLPGPIGAVLQEGTTNTVRVRTYGGMNELGEPDPTVPNDRPFHVTVTC